MSADYPEPNQYKSKPTTDKIDSLPYTYSDPRRIKLRSFFSYLAAVFFSWLIFFLSTIFALSSANDNTSILGIIFAILFTLSLLGFAIGLTYSLFWKFTWSYTFTNTEIIVRHLLHKKRYSVSKLTNINFNSDVREHIYRGSVSKRRTVWLATFEFANDTNLKIEGADFGNFDPLPENDKRPTQQAIELDLKQKQILETLVDFLKPIYLPYQSG